MILADASVWIDFLADRDSAEVEALATAVRRGHLGIADLTITEVMQGIRDNHEYERTLFRLSGLPMITVGGRTVAVAAAVNYRFLRARGITVRKTIDTLLATRCIVDDHTLLFRDRDFTPFVTHLGMRSVLT